MDVDDAAPFAVPRGGFGRVYPYMEKPDSKVLTITTYWRPGNQNSTIYFTPTDDTDPDHANTQTLRIVFSGLNTDVVFSSLVDGVEVGVYNTGKTVKQLSWTSNAFTGDRYINLNIGYDNDLNAFTINFVAGPRGILKSKQFTYNRPAALSTTIRSSYIWYDGTTSGRLSDELQCFNNPFYFGAGPEKK
ncbi:hypothetical protein ABW20_dc0110465 [Dactylellina cionopaga]|nr:hypothetical protein ABW20_dc0110465 [Dactylellina cionopaga]